MTDNITVRGFVATEIKSSTTPGGVPTANFRMGATERRFDRKSDTWIDGNTNWFTVQGYRQLAGNMGCSIKKGQRVIVVGKLKLRSWEKDGRIHHAVEIDAESVGHDLMWGSANFIRTASAGSQAAEQAAGRHQDADPAAMDGGQEDADDPTAQRDPDGGFGDDASGPDGVDLETGELKDSAA